MTDSFAVDTQRLRAVSQAVDAIADELGAGRFGILGKLDEPKLNEYGVSAAYRQFFDLWTDEMLLAKFGTEQFAEALIHAATMYDQTDAAGAQSFGSR